MQELLVSKLSRKCVMGARLIDKQYASKYKLANTCNVQSDDMRAKNVTQFFHPMNVLLTEFVRRSQAWP